MIRAIFFDFYSVWTPDQFLAYLAEARQQAPDAALALEVALQRYYFGEVDVEYLADTIRYKLNRPEVDASQLILREADILPPVIDFMRGLHAHFVKLGVFGNIGKQEYDLLTSFNNHNQLFEVITGPIKSQLALLSQPAFAEALQAIGEPPRSTLIVTGHEDYQRFTESLGIAAIKFESFPKLRQILDQILTSESS